MNSLEFIKQHVTEWPRTVYHSNLVGLTNDGKVWFYDSIISPPYYTVDLTEHFAPDYYDGKVWTREEFEACGVVEYRYNESLTHPLLKREDRDYYYHDDEKWCEYIIINASHWGRAVKISDSMAANYLKQGGVVELVVDWSNAPNWATSYGFAGLSKTPVWYNHQRYSHVDNPNTPWSFSNSINFDISDITPHSHRPTPSVESQPDNLDDGKKYEATIIGLCGTAVKIDIYRVLDAYPQVDPHIEHLIKKALKPGERGHKDKRTDYLNIIESAQKALILLDQKERLSDE